MILATVPLTVEEPEAQPHVGRIWGLMVLTLLLFIGLGARLWVLQTVRFIDYERLASRNRARHEPAEAPRGGIFDRRGSLLAGSRLAARVAILNLADPREQLSRALSGPVGPDLDFEEAAALAALPHPPLAEQLAELARLLPLTADEQAAIRRELEDPTRPKFTPVVVREDLDPVLLTRVEERLWRLPSVVIEKVPLRWYPRAAVTAHVVGYVGIISPDELDERRSKQDQEIAALKARIQQARHEFSDEQMPELEQLLDRLAILQRLRSHAETMVGKTGLEAQYEDYLQGEPAIRTWQVNARNEPVKLLATRAGAPGNSVYLNLDAAMQDLAARLLRGRRGSAVAIDPRDGAVLTIYGSPSYDPNLFIPRIRSRDWARILNDPARPLQNRAIRNIYPPGSTFKLVTSAAGLEAGSITPRTTVSCPGGLQVGSMFKRCWSTHGGGIDLTRALAVSCDTYYYRAALKMGPHPVLDTAAMFGLGAPTGIDLPNEHPGRLPTDEWHRRHHERDWYPGDTANIAIGQGDIAATSLQMALVAATVANGGTIYQPQVVREIRSRDGRVVRRWQPKRLRRIPLPPESIERIRHGLRVAVTNGTAGAAALPNIAVAGKTGSAEDPPRNLPHAWFVCFAPYDQPQIAVAVMVENAGHGGENSAPVAKALMEQYFRSRGITP